MRLDNAHVIVARPARTGAGLRTPDAGERVLAEWPPDDARGWRLAAVAD